MLQQRILQTLRFFSLQGIPLTLLELHKYLIAHVEELRERLAEDGELIAIDVAQDPVTLNAVIEALRQLQSDGLVIERLGYFALHNQSHQIESRWRGYRYGIQRERLIKRWVSGLRYIPFIEAVGITGSQALGFEKQGSDIDLFIVTSKNFLWTARTLVTAYFHILGIRRHGKHIANRMCLNHYVAGVKEFTSGRNLYTALEYAKLRPVFGKNVLTLFQKENAWIQSFFPNWQVFPRDISEKFVALRNKRVLGGAGLERLLRKSQIGRIETTIKFVIVESDELSFHPNSKQEKLLEEFFATGVSS